MSGPLSLAAAWGPGVRAGIDEAGRGPLAGPVFAAAVVLDPGVKIDGLDDSKRLSPARREALREEIVGRARGYGVGRAEVREIDRLNILQATLLAMKRAFDQLTQDLGSVPDEALVDGRICPGLDCPARGLVKGDASVAEIAAASILAKVGRDREMLALNEHYPLYRFDRHKGYPTALHLGRLAALGVSPVHRRSFAPVRALLE